MNDIAVRPALAGELDAVAGLRWRWLNEVQREPATTRDEFIRRFVTWAQENESSHRCMVIVRGDVLIGMAWLAITQRVPHPGALDRATGDVQCVYVLPHERDGGLGDRLIDAVLGLARELALERVTVHSSDRAIPAYARRGFAVSPRLLQTKITPWRWTAYTGNRSACLDVTCADDR